MQCFKCGSDVAKGGLSSHLLQFCSKYPTRNQFQYNIPLKFKDVSEIELFAQDFIVDNRIASLENDVDRCLPYTKSEPTRYAPFPALLYCFSVIDLLGALLAGHAISGDTVKNSKNYMERYLSYPKDTVDHLQRIYRHKLVHLSEPKPVFFHNNNQQILYWKHNEDEPSKHLTIEPLSQQVNILGSLYPAANFIISIRELTKDIKNSVMKSPGGYLADLKNNRVMQYNFVRALNQIFDPSPGV